MELIECKKCNRKLCYAADSDTDIIQTIKIICPCGEVNKRGFLGYPKLSGTEDCYFEFTDEDEITCKDRN